MALFRFTPTLDPINALLNLQRDLDRVLRKAVLFGMRRTHRRFGSHERKLSDYK